MAFLLAPAVYSYIITGGVAAGIIGSLVAMVESESKRSLAEPQPAIIQFDAGNSDLRLRDLRRLNGFLMNVTGDGAAVFSSKGDEEHPGFDAMEGRVNGGNVRTLCLPSEAR